MTIAYLHSKQPALILRQARDTIAVSLAEVSAALTQLGDTVSAEEYARYEDDRLAAEMMPAYRWYLVCKVLCLPSDVVVEGYCEDLQLAAVRHALQTQAFAFPVGEALRRSLDSAGEGIAADLERAT
jgi:hypothetical protein